MYNIVRLWTILLHVMILGKLFIYTRVPATEQCNLVYDAQWLGW